jgi:hypothetical protein
VATRLNGKPPRYNNTDPYLPDLLICLPHVHQPLSAALAQVGH